MGHEFKTEKPDSINQDLLGLVENSSDGLTILDGQGRHLVLNPAFERVTGIKKSKIIGRKIFEISKVAGQNQFASLKVIQTKKPQTSIVTTKNGRQIMATAVPTFNEFGEIFRIYCTIRDVTEINNLKQELEQSQRFINKFAPKMKNTKKHLFASDDIIAQSAQMKTVLDIASRIANVDATVLLTGESGVGKELIARMIHEGGSRSGDGSFVKLNCGAIPEDLLESELFGYEPGAFTGASKKGKPGFFEIADQGTLLLDEIGDLPFKLQVKILCVLQDNEVTRLGGTKSKPIDVRIVAATNQNLEKMVQSGTFREDLFYRLNVVPIHIPPLRERKEDIPFLLAHYLKIFNRKYGVQIRQSKELVDVLTAYRWPGNVRELANLVERLVVTTDDIILHPKHLPAKFMSSHEEEDSIVYPFGSLKQKVEYFELSLIEKALSMSTTLEEAAHMLGISLSTLTRRKRMLKIDRQN